MDDAAVIQVAREAFVVIIKTGGPVLLSGLVVGLMIALFQALTSLQEMTLVFVPKIVVVFGAIVLLMPFMISVIVEFGQSMFARMATLG